MKVLWLTELYPRSERTILGGVQARCFYVGRYIKKKSEIIVLDSINEKWANPSIASFLVRLAYFFINIGKGIEIDFDLIESSNAATHLQAWVIGRIKHKPVVFWYPDVFIGSWIEKFGIVGFFGEFAERLVLFLSPNKYIAISEEVKQKLIKHGVDEAKITVISCGVDFVSVNRINQQSFNKVYDIICISRLLPYKRVSDLINAVALIVKENKSLKVLIIGDGPDKRKIDRLITDLKLGSNIRLISRVESHFDVLKLISKSRILCHPSIVEGFGIVLAEAMSLGTPYVASDIEVIREITKDGIGGLLFKAGDFRNLKYKIKEILNNRALYRQKVKEGSEIGKEYDWENISRETISTYKDLLTPKPRIALISDAWWPVWGGGQVHIWETSKILVDKFNCMVDIYSPNFGSNEQSPKYKNINSIILGPRLASRNLILRGIISLIIPLTIAKNNLSRHYAVIHGHGYISGLSAKLTSILTQLPVVETVHGSNLMDSGKKSFMFYVEKILLTKIHFDKQITVARNFSKYANVNSVVYIPNGVDVEKFNSETPKGHFKINTLLWVGRMDKIKGLDFLVEVVSKLVVNYPNLTVRLVGDGPEKNNLAYLVKRKKLEKIIKFVGPKYGDDLLKEYRGSAAFILPSLSEGFPLTVLEAMACGLPIISTKVGELPLILKENKNGFFAPPGDIRGLAETIDKSLKSRNIKSISKNNYLLAKKYSWFHATEKIYSQYQKVI